MGVVGYTFDEVNAMPMDAIERAISSRIKFVNSILRAAFGGESEAPAVATREMTSALYDAVFQ